MNIFKSVKLPWSSSSSPTTPPTESPTKILTTTVYNNNSIEVPGYSVFTTMEFFETFIQSAAQMGLLKTALPENLTRYHIRTASLQLLQAARVDQIDVLLTDDINGGTIALTNRGLHHVEMYLAFKVENKAAINIQRIWKGYATRKRVLDAFMKDSQVANEMHMIPNPAVPPIPANQLGLQQDYLENYVKRISDMYYAVLNAQRIPTVPATPSQDEVEFMQILNHPDTFQTCHDYLSKLTKLEMEPRLTQRRMTMLPGMMEKQDTMLLYNEFSPKIAAWFEKVLNVHFDPTHDLMFILRSGEILCRLLTTLYPSLTCVLLQKGPEYGIHKIDDIMIRPDLDLNRKSALIVVRSIIALEKHARKNGWEGPSMGLKSTVSTDLGVGTGRESVIQETSSLLLQPNSSLSVSPKSAFRETKEMAAPLTDFAAPIPPPPSKPKKQKKRGRPTPPSIIASSMSTLTPIIEDNLSGLVVEEEEEEEEEDVSDLSKELPPPPISKDSVIGEFDADAHYKSLMQSSFQLGSILDDGIVPDVELNFTVPPPKVSPVSLVPTAAIPPAPISTTEKKDQELAVEAEAEIREREVKEYSAIVERRNKCVEDLLSEEQSYMSYLNSISAYIGQLITMKRESVSHSPMNDGVFSATMLGNTPSFTLSASPLPQHPSESSSAYSFRLENEITELEGVAALLESMLGVHQLLVHLLSRSNRVLGPLPNQRNTYNAFLISQCTMEFINAIQTPYATFSVKALSCLGEYIQFSPKEVNMIVDSVTKHINASLAGGLGIGREPSAREWRVYLGQTVQRLDRYRSLFNEISQSGSRSSPAHLDGYGRKEVWRDDCKLRMAAARIGCIHDSIFDHFAASADI